MQAPPSTIASGEQTVCSLPSSLPASALLVADGIGLAHDAGNLLGAIRLYCDLLALPGVLRSEHRHYAEELQRLTARSGSLIDRLLRPADPARESAWGPAERLADRVCPAEVALECRGMLDPIAEPGSLLIAVEVGAKGDIAVPRETLERILVNLIKNAAEAMTANEKGGVMTIRVRAVVAWGLSGAEGIALSVEDCGRGMNEAALRSALSGRDDGAGLEIGEARPGRGLGLRVVRELTARTGGELRMRSRAGHGTTVEIVWASVPREGKGSG